MPTWVIIGASSGIGLDLVQKLAARGEKVFATCRSRASSASGTDSLSEITGDVTILEGIDIAQDGVGAALAASALSGVTIDYLIHNAGSFGNTRDVKGMAIFAEQKLDAVTMDRMRAAFELNTLGPLRVQQALNGQMKTPGGKIAIINTGFGSIGDNGSGGNYAYRTSKAGANMIAKSLSCDLKAKEIPVVSIAPGMVVTELAGDKAMMEKIGCKPVGQATAAIIDIMDGLGMDGTGQFLMIPTNGDPPKPMPW